MIIDRHGYHLRVGFLLSRTTMAALSDFCCTRRQLEGRDATPMEEDELLQDVCEAAVSAATSLLLSRGRGKRMLSLYSRVAVIRITRQGGICSRVIYYGDPTLLL